MPIQTVNITTQHDTAKDLTATTTTVCPMRFEIAEHENEEKNEQDKTLDWTISWKRMWKSHNHIFYVLSQSLFMCLVIVVVGAAVVVIDVVFVVDVLILCYCCCRQFYSKERVDFSFFLSQYFLYFIFVTFYCVLFDFIAFNISMCMFKGMKFFGLFEPISNEKEWNFNIKKLGRASKIYKRSLKKIKTSILSKCIVNVFEIAVV